MNASSPTLADTIVELLDAFPDLETDESLRVTRLAFDVPIDLRLAHGPDGWTLLGTPPPWRWSTVWDREPSRLSLSLGSPE